MKIMLLTCFLFLIFLININSGFSDLCHTLSVGADERVLFQSAAPLGAADAGDYTKDSSASTLADCLLSCCSRETCDVVFFHQNICFEIACNTSYPGGCDPVTHSEEKFKETYMIIVRPVHAFRPSASQSLPLTETASPSPVSALPVGHYKSHIKIKSDCATDGDDCMEHASCVLSNDPSTIGYVCQCIQGYEKSSVANACRHVASKELLASGTNTTMNGLSLNISQTTTLPMQPQTSPSAVSPLVVSVGESRHLQYPINSAILSAYVLPVDSSDAYKYQWILERHPEGEHIGQMEDMTTSKLKLSKLKKGLYTFKVSVSADGRYGEGHVNVTVHPPTRKNVLPIVIIKPPSQKVNEPNDVVLDGSESYDDDKITKYHWDQVSGPVKTQTMIDAPDSQMLVLKGLSPGAYIFKLTVTDSDGETNSTLANVTVVKEIDYPPKANAGSNVILSLPINSVTLMGNSSTDDKGIVSYEWIKKSADKITADMTGVRTPFLHLENLEAGDYTFTLKVTDSAGQTSMADVQVFVKEEHNKPPVAKVVPVTSRITSSETVTLDGSQSTDDDKITRYTWTQVSGPASATLNNADRAVATGSHFTTLGTYIFQLTVEDQEGLQGSQQATIKVNQNENQHPKADAGPKQIVTLPQSLFLVNGSNSSDDRGIVSYQWKRAEGSLSAGIILNNSDQNAVMFLSDLIPGLYLFELQVTDAEGLKNTASTTLVVKPDPRLNDMAEIQIAASITTFTEQQKKNLKEQLSLILHSSSATEGRIEIEIMSIEPLLSTGNLDVVFLVRTGDSSNMPAAEVVKTLKSHLSHSPSMLDFAVLSLETLICHNNCSGHGQCHLRSKQCICEAFWMPSLFRLYIGDGITNCDWSVLYVTIFIFCGVVGTVGLVWACFCVCRKLCCRGRKSNGKHRYFPLASEEKDAEAREILPKDKLLNSSLMKSESEFSSEEETLFINHKKTNGHYPGIQLGKPKLKM